MQPDDSWKWVTCISPVNTLGCPTASANAGSEVDTCCAGEGHVLIVLPNVFSTFFLHLYILCVNMIMYVWISIIYTHFRFRFICSLIFVLQHPTCIFTCIYDFICICICTYVCIYIIISISICMCICLCIDICVYVYVYVRLTCISFTMCIII